MAELPSGTVTFLLTDIEGSTPLWDEAPGPMRAALTRHDALFESEVTQHGGVHIRSRGEGDSRFAVFSSAPGALAAAVAIQRTFAAEPWPTPRPIRVRIGIHTGEAELRDGDYYGSAVNRCARLRGIGHGGQTLLSEATGDAARGRLPGGASLHDLGRHRLRGLARPERVFQLVIPGLARDFPALTSLDARPNNLPIPPTPLLGRDREVQAVRSLLLRDDVRLVTLTGPGGAGKTRLGLQVAADLVHHGPDGVFLVELAPITDPGLVIPTLAQVLGLREDGGRSLDDTLTRYLKEKHLLLVLDNFEQILSAAPVVADLLARCPKLTVLATSRAVLHVRGEREFVVPPLALPDPKQTVSAEVLGQYAAVALFVQRAVAARAGFGLTDENAPSVAEICRRLDGLPLAIELAAARITVLSPEVLLHRLGRRLPLLRGGPRDAPARQRTLRDTIAWSYDLLNEAEQRLFRRLAVFVGGFTLEAAEAICDATAGRGLDVVDGMGSLVDQSLLRRDDETGEGRRFAMLETIREYALEQLEADDEAAELRRRHAAYCVELVEAAEPELTGPRQAAWLDRLEAEHDNLRTALRWTVEHGEVELGLRLGGALWQFWDVRGHLTEARERLSEMLAAARSARRTPALAKVRHSLGNVAWAQGDFAAARVHYEGSLEIQRELGIRGGIASSLNNLGNVEWDQGEYAAARAHYEESLAIRRELVDSRGIADSLHNLADVELDQGEYAAARVHYEESLAIRRQMGDSGRVAYSLNNLGNLNLAQGEYAAARALLEESLAIRRSLGDRSGIADSLNCLGNVARAQGAAAAARAHYEESLAIQQELADRRGIADVLQNLGSVARAQGDQAGARACFEESLAIRRELGDRRGIAESLESCATLALEDGRAGASVARLLGAAEALRAAIGAPLSPGERTHYDRMLAAARAALGEESFTAAWHEGRTMTMEQAVAHALERPESA